MSCCDVNGLRGMFRGPMVAHELRTFKRRGLDRRQRLLVAAAGDVRGASVLEIGCGIAAPSLTLLEAGAARAMLVDVSPDYLAAARQLAQERGQAPHVSLHQGDFLDVTPPEPADIVLLDRVVCCYPDARRLLEKAAAWSGHKLILSYPRQAWWSRLFIGGVNVGMRLMRRDYRAYLHPPRLIRQAATSAGHAQVASRTAGPWRLELYERARG